MKVSNFHLFTAIFAAAFLVGVLGQPLEVNEAGNDGGITLVGKNWTSFSITNLILQKNEYFVVIIVFFCIDCGLWPWSDVKLSKASGEFETGGRTGSEQHFWTRTSSTRSARWRLEREKRPQLHRSAAEPEKSFVEQANEDGRSRIRKIGH